MGPEHRQDVIPALHVLALSGSPAPRSRTARLADGVLERIRAAGAVTTRHIRLAELDGAALAGYRLDHPDVAMLNEAVAAAHGVVIATPIFKASYSGLTKVALDVLPQFALAGKVVLPLGTGGTTAHVLALDYALRPVLQSMAARHVVQAHFVAEAEVDAPDPGGDGLAEAVRNFLHSLTDRADARWLGHPRPEVV